MFDGPITNHVNEDKTIRPLNEMEGTSNNKKGFKENFEREEFTRMDIRQRFFHKGWENSKIYHMSNGKQIEV